MASSRFRSLLVALVVLPFKAAWVASVVAIPAIGVWVASSLAAYRNGPVWLACVCGLLLFPLAPLAWEAIGTWLRGRKQKVGPRILTFLDRLILRTLVINLAVLGGLLMRWPETTFAALSTRGDWFLDGRSGPPVERARAGLFFAADRLQWLYEAVHENPYADDIAEREPPPLPTPVPGDSTRPAPGPAPTPGVTPVPVPGVTPMPVPEPGVSTPPPAAPLWPAPEVLHPLVVGMPAEAEVSIASVAQYIKGREPDQRLRIKALHDYVADRVAYDAVALAEGRYPPQDAETTFRTRLSVCAGYANLLAALGDAAGEEIVVIGGDARNRGSDVTGEPHAWNAARIDDVWHLIDATWGAGSVEGRVFTKRYGTSYLFAPPEVFVVSHFPEEENWQLLATPRSRGDFFRAPMMGADFYAAGLELVTPDRSQVTVERDFEVVLNNPQGRFFLANYRPVGGEKGRCEVRNGATARVRCPLPAATTYEVMLFVGTEEFGTYTSVGTFEVHRKD